MTRETLRKVMRLKIILESCATGGACDNEEFQKLMKEITSDKSLNSYFPDFLMFCDSLDEFWMYIKDEYTSYKKRRQFLSESLYPLLNHLEQEMIDEKKISEANQNIPPSFHLKIKKLQIMLEARATGNEGYDEKKYQEIREEIISLENLQNYIPDFLLVCYSLDDFWSFIKNEYTSYKERRKFLKDSFFLLYSYAKNKEVSVTPQSTSTPRSTPIQKPTSTPRSTPIQKPTSIPRSTPIQKPTSIPRSTPIQKPTSIPRSTPIQRPTSTPRSTPIQKEDKKYKYDIAFSFAGEDRALVESIAQKLEDAGKLIFYDDFSKVDLWGEKLTTHFENLYANESRFVIVFISEHYRVKDWTDFEFDVLHAESKKRKGHYILPIRIDETRIMGLSRDLGYLDMANESIGSVVEAIIKKLNSDA